MANYKGTTIVFFKKQILQAGDEKVEAFKQLLTDQEYGIWEKTLSFHWVPMEVANQLWIKTGKALYPNLSEDDSIYKLGIDMANDHIKGLYRLVFKIISPQVILKKSASLWRTYNQAGDSSTTMDSPNRMTFSVMNYPELPPQFCQSVGGYIHGLFAIAGCKNISVIKKRKDTGWIWIIDYTRN